MKVSERLLQRPEKCGNSLARHLAGDLAAIGPFVTGTHFEQALSRCRHVVIGDAGNGAVVCGLGLAYLVFERLEKKFGSIGVHMNLLSSCAVPRSVTALSGLLRTSSIAQPTQDRDDSAPQLQGCNT